MIKRKMLIGKAGTLRIKRRRQSLRRAMVLFALLLFCSVTFAQSNFVRGSKVIFEDNLANETVGSRPSKWIMDKDYARVAMVNGEKVIRFQFVHKPDAKGRQLLDCTVRPKLTTPDKSLLRNFTIEFDFTVSKDANGHWTLITQRRDDHYGGECSILLEISAEPAKNSFYGFRVHWKGNPGGNTYIDYDLSREGWHRLALSYREGVLNVYLDGKNLLNASNVIPSDLFDLGVYSYNAERFCIRNILICGDEPAKSTIAPKPPFVPGAVTIFEDKLDNETAGAAPSKWNLQLGKAEITQFNNENVVMIPQFAELIPAINPSKNYLPDNYTIELDFYAPRNKEGVWTLELYEPNSEIVATKIVWNGGAVADRKKIIGVVWKTNLGEEQDATVGVDLSREGWHRLAVSCQQGAVNLYIDGVHLQQAGNVSKAGWFTLQVITYEKTGYYLRNARVGKITE